MGASRRRDDHSAGEVDDVEVEGELVLRGLELDSREPLDTRSDVDEAVSTCSATRKAS
jgi:hypothetical protein